MIILTGGAGFIGSVLLWKLNAEGITDIVVADRITSDAKWRNLLGKRFRYLATPEECLDRLRHGAYGTPTAILHFGARTNTTERDVAFLLETNYRYSVRLAEYALEHDVPLIYASSASIYGDGFRGYSPALMTEARPLNAYALSKYLFDLWVHENGALDRVVGLRLFNVYGPNEYHKGEMASMVYKAFLQIQKTGAVHLFESTVPELAHGEQKRDFVYVKDVVEVVWRVLQSQWSQQPVRGIHNLGTGVARSWNELARAVFAALDREPKIIYIPMPDQLRAQYQNFTQADIASLQAALARSGSSFSPTPLDDGVRDYVCTYLRAAWAYL